MQAIVMAGGKGTRLQPFTATFPKPLVPLGDMPVLEILLRQIRRRRHRRGHPRGQPPAPAHPRVLRRRSGVRPQDRLQPRGRAAGHGGPIAASWTGSIETFVVTNGDLLTSFDIAAMVRGTRNGARRCLGRGLRAGDQGRFRPGRDRRFHAADRLSGEAELSPIWSAWACTSSSARQCGRISRPAQRLDMPDLMKALVAVRPEGPVPSPGLRLARYRPS